MVLIICSIGTYSILFPGCAAIVKTLKQPCRVSNRKRKVVWCCWLPSIFYGMNSLAVLSSCVPWKNKYHNYTPLIPNNMLHKTYRGNRTKCTWITLKYGCDSKMFGNSFHYSSSPSDSHSVKQQHFKQLLLCQLHPLKSLPAFPLSKLQGLFVNC